MNLKKGLSYVAFGFLFTLVELNLNFQNGTINVMPDFIGWILFFLAFDKLGIYVENKKYLKWISLVMIILTGTIWVLGIAKPEISTDILTTTATIISLIYMFILFGAVEQIARDDQSKKESTIHMLKIINLVLYAGFVITALGFAAASQGALAMLAAVLGVAALVAAIVTLVVLFQLRKEISGKLMDEE